MTSNFAGEIVLPPIYETRGRKRKYHADRAATSSETNKAHRAHALEERIKRIGTFDTETDPFDKETQEAVYPFTACFYAADIEPIVIWEDDFERFIERLLEALESITEPHTFYAHNGGRFDFMFLIHKLRGSVSFKGRGLMVAKIGIHELRDSTHILPMKLSEWKKDNFEYWKMKKEHRHTYRDEIIKYMIQDCKDLFEIVLAFVHEFGFKLTIGQAAMTNLRAVYPNVKKIGEQTDEKLRGYFFGGRVECLAGAGHFVGDYKLFDVNSMYPSVMARFRHPIGNHYTFRRTGGIRQNTAFVEVECRNYTPGGIGALVTRTDKNETSATVERGVFRTSIYEFEAAMELGLIDDVNVLQYVDNDLFTDFAKFIVPMYERRQVTKGLMRDMKNRGVEQDSPEFLTVKKEDIFLKFLLNNSYGKFAINPRRFKDSYITAHGDPRPPGFENCLLPTVRNPVMGYDIWERPSPRRNFNNVGTAASITGAARSVLMRAIVNAVDPIYCDTDSLICRSLDNVEIDKIALGAWDLEAEFEEVAIAGKKLYACRPKGYSNGQGGAIKVRSKGVPEGSLDWDAMMKILRDEVVSVVMTAPTLTKSGKQSYMHRDVRRTAPVQRRNTSNFTQIERLAQ